jgi:hypothetical protein
MRESGNEESARVEGKSLALTVGAAGIAVIAVGTSLMYLGGPPPAPPRPQPAPPPETLMNSELKYSPLVYRGFIEHDARSFGVDPPAVDVLAQPNPYFEELASPRKVTARDPLTTAHLKIAVEVGKQKATIDGQAFATDHLLLRIENRTDRYLAYRVDTEVPDTKRCRVKGELPHDAIVIAPREVLVRSECLHRSGTPTLRVTRVEVIELPELSAHYVSRLPATALLFDPRVAGGHVPRKGALCPQTFSWREVKEGLTRRQLGWRDVIDFYARHSCEEYSFFPEYRYRTDPGAPLPARSRG